MRVPAAGWRAWQNLDGGHHPFEALAHLARQRRDVRFADQLEHRIGVHEFHADLAVRDLTDKHVTRQQ